MAIACLTSDPCKCVVWFVGFGFVCGGAAALFRTPSYIYTYKEREREREKGIKRICFENESCWKGEGRQMERGYLKDRGKQHTYTHFTYQRMTIISNSRFQVKPNPTPILRQISVDLACSLGTLGKSARDCSSGSR